MGIYATAFSVCFSREPPLLDIIMINFFAANMYYITVG